MEKLEAVNYLLRILGSSPVGDLESLHPQVAIAVDRLNAANATLQKEGWWFNQEYHYVIEPDATSAELELPLHTLEANVVSRANVVKRGDKLYDTINHTYQFTTNVTVNLTFLLDWDLLDDVVQEAAQYFAGMLVCQIDLEDTIKENGQAKLFNSKLSNMKKTHLRTTRRNIMNSPATLAARARVRPYSSRSGSVNPLYPGG